MKRLLVVGLLVVTEAAAAPGGGGIYPSKHNFSVTGAGAIKAQDERRACVFCHAAHTGKPGGRNRPDTATRFQTYRSSTMAARPSAGPTGASRVCLSCHDGTIAVGDTVRGRIAMTGASDRLAGAPSSFGFDLTTTHPVSFAPAPSAATRRPAPSDPAKLDRSGQVQCTSCHDPHSEDADPVEKQFLVASNRNGALCLTCHALPAWQANPSAHQSSLASTRVPGSKAVYPTVAESACGSCHASHGAGAASLLKVERGASEDRVCLGCHDGRVAKLDVAREVAKPYAHAMVVAGPTGHDAGEGPFSATARLPESRMSQPRHVACVDCHEPHSAFSRPAIAPRASGAISGTWGIDRNGMRVQPVSYEYEVCFKCHADSANQPQLRGPTGAETVRRAVVDVNLRRVFGPDAASSHPVLGPGKNPTIPGLVSPMSAGTILYCGDCHASDAAAGGAGAPRGPHGSIYPHLLERSYSTVDRLPESAASYALCYKCHDRTTLLSGASDFSRTAPVPGAPRQSLHQLHLASALGPASCAACHNAHGVSALAGNPQSNAHLVDFDVSVVKPSARGLRQYATRGPRSWSCSLSCHGKDHDNLGY